MYRTYILPVKLLLVLCGIQVVVLGASTRCNTCENPPDCHNRRKNYEGWWQSCSVSITIGTTKPQQDPPPGTACNRNEHTMIYGLVICNYDGCCEHCLKKYGWSLHGKVLPKGLCVSTEDLKYLPELVAQYKDRQTVFKYVL